MSANANKLAPTRDDFAALLQETYGDTEAFEGTVVKGTVVAIEKDMAVIDIGLKTEGRVAVKEFAGPNRDQVIKVGDVVEVYLEPLFPATKPAAKKAGLSLKKRSKLRKKLTALSSIKLRAASRSILTALWPSCHVRRLIFARSAMSAR